MNTTLLSDYDYPYPASQVALEPSPHRDDAQLLVMERQGDLRFEFRHVRDLPQFLQPGDCLVLNDVKVLPIRLHAVRAQGGVSEVLLVADERGGVLRRESFTQRNGCPPRFRALISRGKRIRKGITLEFSGGYRGRVLEPLEPGIWLMALESEGGNGDFLLQCGQMPVPPYLERKKDAAPHYRNLDLERYQTVFAEKEGAIAAPTAGLHFTKNLLEQVQAKGIHVLTITLYVSYATFQPIRQKDFRQHELHEEWYDIPEKTARFIHEAKQTGHRVIAVGTTVTRALESAAMLSNEEGALVPGYHATRLFIHTDFSFRIVDGMVTNFHLPKSSLLLLVCAFSGRERVLAAYRDAIARGFRLFSYGDAMLIHSRKERL